MGSFGEYSFFVVSLLRHSRERSRLHRDRLGDGGKGKATERRSDEGKWEKSDGGTKRRSDEGEEKWLRRGRGGSGRTAA